MIFGRMLLVLVIALPSLVIGQTCCGSSTQKASVTLPQERTIVETAVGAGQFKTLVAAVKAAGLVPTLSGQGPFTVFAPTDAAFAKLPEGTVENLLKPENKELLARILTFHVVAGSFDSKKVVASGALPTVMGQRVAVTADDDGVAVGGALVVKVDIECSNGIIHVIDRVLLPAEKNVVQVAAGAGTFNTLLAAAKAAGLAETLSEGGPFTVFAPTDDAFAKLPDGTVASLLEPKNREKLASILKYHVVSGRVYSPAAVKAGHATTLQGSPLKIKVSDGKAMVNNAGLVTTDLDASNGVIHVIDRVLLPR